MLAIVARSATDIVGPGGSSVDDYFPFFNGTSAACPYAAGAAAALQSAAKARTGTFLTPSQVRSSLKETGDPITDLKNGVVTPRVNLEQAINLQQNNCLTIANQGGITLQVTSITTPSSSSVRDVGGVEPGVMPPMSAWTR
jgi:subtilisin family serine protease